MPNVMLQFLHKEKVRSRALITIDNNLPIPLLNGDTAKIELESGIHTIKACVISGENEAYVTFETFSVKEDAQYEVIYSIPYFSLSGFITINEKLMSTITSDVIVEAGKRTDKLKLFYFLFFCAVTLCCTALLIYILFLI